MITPYPLWLNIVLYVVLIQLITGFLLIQQLKKDIRDNDLKLCDKEWWLDIFQFAFFFPFGISALCLFYSDNIKEWNKTYQNKIKDELYWRGYNWAAGILLSRSSEPYEVSELVNNTELTEFDKGILDALKDANKLGIIKWDIPKL